MPVKVWEAGATLITGEERDPNGPLSIVGAGRLSGEVAAADAPVLNRVAGFGRRASGWSFGMHCRRDVAAGRLILLSCFEFFFELVNSLLESLDFALLKVLANPVVIQHPAPP